MWDLHRRTGELRQAEAVRAQVHGELREVLRREVDHGLEARVAAVATVNEKAAEALRRSQQGQVPTRAPGSPIPNRIERDDKAAGRVRTGRDSGIER